jgi:aldehyde:ferredoxin oxidoreductase
VRTEYLASLFDSLELCSFCFSPGALWSFADLVDMLQAVNGFSTSLWSLLKTGERRVALLRAFNAREGIGTAADLRPERAFAPLPEGLAEGACVEREAFAEAQADYYAMAGIDPESGRPLLGRLLELDLKWVDDLLTADA